MDEGVNITYLGVAHATGLEIDFTLYIHRNILIRDVKGMHNEHDL